MSNTFEQNQKIKDYTKPKRCSICQVIFKAYYSTSKYCSSTCAVLGNKKSKESRSELIPCKICGKEFKAIRARLKTAKFCSTKCYAKHQRTENSVKIKCKKCSKFYLRARSQVYYRGSSYCSRKCMYGKERSKAPSESTIDTLWAIIVKIKGGNCCEYCGKTTGLNSHHIFSRSNRATRWDIENGVSLCVAHHVFGTFSAHKAPAEFIEWLKEKRGEEWYQALRVRARQVVKPDKIGIKDNLTNILKGLNDQN